MRTVLYRRWAPPQSFVKIEFTPEVLHDIRANSRGNQDRGYLFGKRRGNEVRVLVALREPQQNDTRLVHLEPVGIYASRVRGEVFLTDDDLEQASRVPEGVVLVVAGKRAGFFTRELDGSIQAVRSYEEFAVADVAAEAASPEVLTKPGRPARWRHPALPPRRAWKAALAASVALAGPAIAYAFLQPRMRMLPIEMSIRESDGQLIVAWDPNALAQGGHLNISEGDIQTSISLAAYGSGITYLPQTSDVEVRLSSGGRAGALHWRSSRPQLH